VLQIETSRLEVVSKYFEAAYSADSADSADSAAWEAHSVRG